MRLDPWSFRRGIDMSDNQFDFEAIKQQAITDL